MAKMWPRTLPPEVLNDPLRSTEREVFERLETELDSSFVVFYSRPWLGLRPNGEEIDGECDFTVAHADLGMLALEVKGGAVAYDPRTDRWTSRDRWRVTHNIKNPVHQARSAKHELLKKLKASPHWKARRILARHGVVLPHSSAPSGDLGADMPQRIFCFAERFRNGLRAWILERFGEAPPDEGATGKLGADGLRALEHILAKPFQLRTPLGTLVSGDDAALQQLTREQFHILRMIEANPRAAISGSAGTGKTVLAMEEARRCAESGGRTLFICFNRGLASDVRRRLQHGPPVAVMTFHELCAEWARRAGVPAPTGMPKQQLYEEAWPEVLMQSFERVADKGYDVIVVDEGQDFRPLWWPAIEAGLDPDGGRLLRIFYDNNQRLYGNAIRLPDEVNLVPIRLTMNLRNTRRIHELAVQHYAGHQIEAVGPEGTEIQWTNAKSSRTVGNDVSACVSRLHSVEKVPLGDIAVLVSSEKAIQDFVSDDRLGGLPITRCDNPADGRIVVDSIRRFKGLERPVVVIAATEDTVADEELVYVALSRARAHLVIIGTDSVLTKIRGTVDTPEGKPAA